ncbi:MAG: hypothetical protein AMXMBFR61_02420 [Fimbriimonadales bacterium]
MNKSSAETAHLSVSVTAHSEHGLSCLMVQLEPKDREMERTPDLRVVLVLDRSGSMAGDKLEKCKIAAGRLIRSLGTEDRVGVVTYDNRVDVLCPLVPPSSGLARMVESIQSGGSTNLYGGWVAGAKLLEGGGRVILLSDGLANVGRWTSAEDLSRHAECSYREFMVTTSTIGVGSDYDEALMAGMARAGGGSHYFAHTADDVMKAFSRERFSMGAAAVQHCELRLGDTLVPVGHLWMGERISRILPITDLGGATLIVRYRTVEDEQVVQVEVPLPRAFAYSDEAAVEYQLQRVADLQAEMLAVRSPRAARELRERARALLLDLLNHRLADEERMVAVRAELERAIERLHELEVDYDEVRASVHRKRAMQFSDAFRAPAKAYSTFDEDAATVDAFYCLAMQPDPRGLPDDLDPSLLAPVPVTQWLAWKAMPVRRRRSGALLVAMPNPRDGFLIAEIAGALGSRVEAWRHPVSEQEITRRLLALQAHDA